MTKANQVAPMLAMLRGLIPDATEAIGEFAKLAEYVDETEARATQAERDRDAWRAKWEALETTRAVCCDQMERERDEARATGRDNLAMWEVERDALRAKLAEAEWSFAGYNAKLHAEALRENDVLRSRLAKTEAVVDAARKWSECVERGFAASERPDVARARVLRALRVLDEDSGGASGAATPEGGHAAPTGGPMPPPEPAGSSCRCGAGCKPVPRYAGDDDSPVGVATTESNEGLIPSGACRPDPPPDYLTRSELVVEAWSELSAVRRATMRETFPALHAAFVAAAFPPHTAQPYGHISKANECQIDSPVGVAATAEDGHEAPARNRQPAEPPSDPATGTTRREPPESARMDASTGVVACGYCIDDKPCVCPATRAELDELRRRVERLEGG